MSNFSIGISRIRAVACRSSVGQYASYEPPKDWFKAFSQLLETLNHPEYSYLDALLMAMTGRDAVAVLMLRHLLAWSGKSIRADGAIWRSAEDWSRYCGISRSQAYSAARRETLEKIGVSCWVERAQGENQMHFKIDPHLFTAVVSVLLGKSLYEVKGALWTPGKPVKRAKPSRQTVPRVRSAKGQSLQTVPRVCFDKIPLTYKPTKKTNKKDNSSGASGPLSNKSPKWYEPATAIKSDNQEPDWLRAARVQIEAQFNSEWVNLMSRVKLLEKSDNIIRLEKPAEMADDLFLRMSRNVSRVFSTTLGFPCSVEFVGAAHA